MMTPDSARAAIQDALRPLIGTLPPGTITVVRDDGDPGFNWIIQVRGGGAMLADGAALKHHQQIMECFEAVRNANPLLNFNEG
ncbi:hypothetical protein [Xanthobacter tagetidis]|uniref:hypothetical protein n=1 Tax=Xanthobacter tagetidis TaxID=60216 RepID=UPI0011C42748|nr:hypothetical protein [Xanthobacter tagetidis]MBB6308890.1 hypothetical protein [Xanthobacter tagetidis]